MVTEGDPARASSRRVARVLGAVVLALGAGCQGRGSEDVQRVERGSGSAKPRADAGQPADAAPVADEGSAKPKVDEPELPTDPSKAIAELGAVSAWQAVIDRAGYLVRRDQHGVVYGVYAGPVMVADPAAPAVDAGVHVDAGLVPSKLGWLVDDTEGNGSLAIRVDFGGKSLVNGERVALGGAWVLDEAREYYWKVDNLSHLPAGTKSTIAEPLAEPGHAISDGAMPAGARRISLAKDDDLVVFSLVGAPPANDGDGWPVGDELGSPVVALLNLPGERASYGGQDMRTASEHWTLKRGQSYWVRIGKIHKRGGDKSGERPTRSTAGGGAELVDKPFTVNARTAPVRIK